MHRAAKAQRASAITASQLQLRPTDKAVIHKGIVHLPIFAFVLPFFMRAGFDISIFLNVALLPISTHTHTPF